MKKLCSIAVFLACGQWVSGQDLHYWTNQFGTKASMLGGAVVGGLYDNTAVYYNPASLAFMDSASISVNANLYQLENFKLKNGAGNRKDVKGTNIGTIPLMVGGRLKIKNPNYRIGYGVIAPVNFDFKGVARADDRFNIANDSESPGAEDYIGQVNFSSGLKETDLILGISRKLNDDWSIGLSNIVTLRNHQYSDALIVRMLLNNAQPLNNLVSQNEIRTFTYTHFRYVAKLGVNYNGKKWSYGATVTLPGLKLYGKGIVQGDISGNNINLFGNGRIDYLGNDRQEKMKARYKSPLSIAVGSITRFSRMRLSLSAEYFSGNKLYRIIDADVKPFLRPTSSFPNGTSDRFLSINIAKKAVFNVAAGIEYDATQKLQLITSFRTNFSAYDPSVKNAEGINPYFTSWNLFHWVGGVAATMGNHELSLGLNLGFGADKNFNQSVNLDAPTEGNFLQGELTIAEASYFSAGLILGYNFAFGNKKR